MKFLAPLVLASLVATVMAVVAPAPASAHQSGCHAAHSCPSDTGSYTCGDTGNYTYCGDLSGSVYMSQTSATIGTVLTAYVSWSAASTPTYQWLRAGTAIGGATSTSYTVTADDIGQSLVLTGTATDGRGQTATASSTAITPALPPLPNGTATVNPTSAAVGTTLTAVVTWSRAATATYQWYRDGSPIEGATGINYTTVRGDLGRQVWLVATVTEHGQSTSVATTKLIPVAVASLSIAAVPRAIVAGRTATFRGTFRSVAGSARRAVKVQVWQKLRGRWVLRRTTTVTTSASGTFVVRHRVPGSGEGAWRARATFRGATGVRPASSPFAAFTAS